MFKVITMTDEQKNVEHEYNVADDSQPLCIQCLTPFEPLQHYHCKNCGHTVGSYTRYLPFINIPLEVEFSARIWRWFWREDASILKRICLFPILISFWGQLFLVGLPFELWQTYQNKKS